MATKSYEHVNSLNTIAEQTFKNIEYSKQNINIFSNYFEEDKDYNIENKPNKNSYIDPITVNYIHYHTNYIKIINFEYKGVVFNVNIYTKNYGNNETYIYFIKLAIICCLQNKSTSKEKIYLKLDLYLTELKKALPNVSGARIKKEHTKSGYSIFDNNAKW